MPGQEPRPGPRDSQAWRSAGARREGDYTTVTNMDLAIYCHMKDRLREVTLKVEAVYRVTQQRHEIVFYDPDDVISRLENDFVNSQEAWAFAAAQRSLKSIMREKETRARSSQR